MIGGSTPTPVVQYVYTEMAGGVNNSRLRQIIYPNGRILRYEYNAGTGFAGLDDRISRLSFLADDAAGNVGTHLEEYSYLGLDTVVKRAHPQPGVDLTYIKQSGEANGDAGDQYTGLDRFGRVVDQRWIPTAAPQSPTDRFQYGYDADSNVLYRDNLVNSNFGELYHVNGSGNGYDSLNRLTAFARGSLNTTKDTIASPSHSQSWSLDSLGNWTSVTTDGSTQTRTQNQQNQITSISGATTPGYDNNGNTTQDERGYGYVYDAWDRLVQVNPGLRRVINYGYDALGRRITDTSLALNDLYFSANWQVLEEDQGGVMQTQYIWSPVYVDALVERDTADGTRLYVQQDANYNVTALVGLNPTTGTWNMVQRFVYDPYGAPTALDVNFNVITDQYTWVYLYQGGRYDTVTGLYLFRNRDYSPTLGRWMQLDPMGYAAGSANLLRSSFPKMCLRPRCS